MAAQTPQIKLYTNPLSPWSHRAHIALDELKLPYEQEIVDISKPRTAEYLAINPRGLVPAMSYNGRIVTESAIISTFLADTFSTTSSLLPASSESNGPLMRARISFFVDAYLTKVVPSFMKSQKMKNGERDSALADFVNAIVKELEPLLADAGPFYGGSSQLTLAEVLTGPFIVRAYLLSKHGLMPESLLSDLATKAPRFDTWAKAVIDHPSVSGGIWNEEKMAAFFRSKMGA
ncbi:hypothetical protein LTR10_003412 [Elasticomyces elasticus]|nr:hypothetical protein LTR10_003412 [Elasticomyces elasticus]KAK4969680.1 hypothetical protein LTR42_008952 [Elasticomyces elasticus]